MNIKEKWGSVGLKLSGNKTRRKRGLGQRWEPQVAVRKLCMCSVLLRITAMPSPYQTFQGQRGWLQALSGWSWNSMFGTAVITSASHKQGRAQAHGINKAELCARQFAPRKSAMEFSFKHIFHIIFPPYVYKAHPHFLGHASLTTSWRCATHPCALLPSGIRMGGSWRSHKNTLGKLMPVWENTSSGFAPLSKQHTHTL